MISDWVGHNSKWIHSFATALNMVQDVPEAKALPDNLRKHLIWLTRDGQWETLI